MADERSQCFGEQSQSRYDDGEGGPELPNFERLRLGDGGRVVIPAGMRVEMGIKPGDALIAYVEDGELRLRSFAGNLKRIQKRLSAKKKPGQSVVDEFIADRKAMWGEG